MKNRRVAVAVSILGALACGVMWYSSGPESATSSPAPTIGASAMAATSHGSEGARRRQRVTDAPVREARGQSSLPPPGTPLPALYDELKRRADAGDAEAAMGLLHEVHRCIELRQTRRVLADIPPGMTADQDRQISFVRSSRVQIKRVREMTEYVQANAARCEGATDAQLASFTPLLLQAAQLGDLKALHCYVGSDFETMNGLIDHPEWIDQYKSQVPGLVESALQRGDWLTVELLRHDYSSAFGASPRGQLFGIDPIRDYRLLRLEQLGATGGFADRLAPMVAGAAKALSPAQTAAAEAWAKDYYSRYFNSSSNEVSNGVNICQIGDD